eukprot:CAMPEP_0181130832 /NCGR_PEP_ID=MMETSP1071-20121207/30079_1 /TAXON_ID=35127 /ORGANISM="Thalassiosira sp., Strain NH16" /LENGTH=107 /DNA_ID=CAMNT_0023216939 /DNA_START=431 /DNA_END=751 /DNA_ORIENTATION=+
MSQRPPPELVRDGPDWNDRERNHSCCDQGDDGDDEEHAAIMLPRYLSKFSFNVGSLFSLPLREKEQDSMINFFPSLVAMKGITMSNPLNGHSSYISLWKRRRECQSW